MTARACLPVTSDGKRIVVPNGHVITSRLVNNSDAGRANRYKAAFSVSRKTDINLVPAPVETAVAALPFVLKHPDRPDCALKGSGESAVDFAVEYRVQGRDDGKNNFASPVLFAIWNALKAAGIDRPCPQPVVEIKDRAFG